MEISQEKRQLHNEFAQEFLKQLIIAAGRKEVQPVIGKTKIEAREMPFIRRSFFPTQRKGPHLVPIVQTKEKIDFGKLNEFLDDAAVSYIECLGPERKIKIIKDNIMYETETFLSKEEIEIILKKFSEKTKTPIEKVFRASFKGITINSIASGFLGSRFIITKEAREKKQPEK